MPFVSIANMSEDDFFHIYRIFFLFGRSDIIPFGYAVKLRFNTLCRNGQSGEQHSQHQEYSSQ
jgi:hypothetical protein